jgi:hypothetical protein
MDETHWKVVGAGFFIWGARRATSVLWYIASNEKERITVIAAVDAAGNKLPLAFIN